MLKSHVGTCYVALCVGMMLCILTSCKEISRKAEEPEARAPTGQQCRGTSPNAFPSSPGKTPHSLGNLAGCVPTAQCNNGSALLKNRIVDRYCQSANAPTCDANDDCLNLDCKGRKTAAAVSGRVTLRNCQNTGPTLCAAVGGGDYCLCDAEVNAGQQIECGCQCTNTVLP